MGKEGGTGAGWRGAGGGRRGFPSCLLALVPGVCWVKLAGAPAGKRRAPPGPRRREPAEPALSVPPAAPRAGRLPGAHHHVHQLVAHVRRHRHRRGPPGAAAAAAAAGGGGAQPPAGARPAPPGSARRGRPPGGLHQRPGAQGEPPPAGPPPGPRGSRDPRSSLGGHPSRACRALPPAPG